jgi:hypothetical protein
LDTKFFDSRIKHKLFTRNQRDIQETPVAFQSLPRNAINKDMTFEESRPNRRKIISLATNSVHWRARSLALSFDIFDLPFVAEPHVCFDPGPLTFARPTPREIVLQLAT